jgi:spermidine synthase
MINNFSENGVIIPENLIKKNNGFNSLMSVCANPNKEKTLFETNSDFHNISVCENKIGRFLKYGISYQAGIINTPMYKGNLPYLNYFLLARLFNKNIKKILLIGFGIGLLAKQLHYLFPELEKFDSVDIEENILSIAENYFDFQKFPNFEFHLQDALVYLRNNKTKYDLIITDVAGNEGIDERFFEEDFFLNIKKSLKKNGFLAFNSCSNTDFNENTTDFYGFTINTFKKYFKNFAVFDGKTSDMTYYKTFFNINERALDITNAIFFASDKNFSKNLSSNIKTNELDTFNHLNVNILPYLKDLHKFYIS